MAVYDALEATRRDSPRPWARLLDPLFLTGRFALVGAIGGHFASVVSARRLWAANPWLASASRALSILQPTATLVDQLNALAPSIVATYPTAAALLADEARRGTLTIRPQEVWIGGETLSPSQRSAAHRAGPGLRGAQQLRRVRVPADRLGMRPRPVARQRRLGGVGAGRRRVAARDPTTCRRFT